MIRFDAGPLPGGTLFADPLDLIRADNPEDAEQALARIEAARSAGRWLAGYLSYELGYALAPQPRRLMPAAREVPLILMGVFDAPRPAPPLPDHAGVVIGPARPLWTRDRYDRAIQAVHRYIAAGDTYQINLTFPMKADVAGDPLAVHGPWLRASRWARGPLSPWTARRCCRAARSCSSRSMKPAASRRAR